MTLTAATQHTQGARKSIWPIALVVGALLVTVIVISLYFAGVFDSNKTGETCNQDNPCDKGKHCNQDSGKCEAGCKTDQDCPTSQTCDVNNGQCHASVMFGGPALRLAIRSSPTTNEYLALVPDTNGSGGGGGGYQVRMAPLADSLSFHVVSLNESGQDITNTLLNQPITSGTTFSLRSDSTPYGPLYLTGSRFGENKTVRLVDPADTPLATARFTCQKSNNGPLLTGENFQLLSDVVGQRWMVANPDKTVATLDSIQAIPPEQYMWHFV